MFYGYEEIRFPVLEHTELFKRTIGSVTDIVEKEMYSFVDTGGENLSLRPEIGSVTDIVEKEMYSFVDTGGENLSLRPEGTAGCVRAGIEHGLFYGKTRKLWYMGPMFRHERPQRGRFRQFHQFGVESFGIENPEIEVEHILMMKRLWETLGISDHIVLHVNTLGSSREIYKDELVKYFKIHEELLDYESKNRLMKNPLRILDSKNSDMKNLISNAPKIIDYLDEASKEHFLRFKRVLDEVGIDYIVDPNLVRGLDYYNLTVYEWVTDKLGTQSAVCAGGRYDKLVSDLGGKQTFATGFALGLERIIELLLINESGVVNVPDAYLITSDKDAMLRGLSFIEDLLNQVENFKVVTDYSGSSLKSQFKRADKSRAQYAFIIGKDELEKNMISVKVMREGKQEMMTFENLVKFLNN